MISLDPWALRNTLNWSFVSDYVKWLITNEEDLRNLDVDGHWSRKMTPEEIEMKKHPNRSMAWIPNRIKEMRNTLRAEVFLYLAHRVTTPGDWGAKPDLPCLHCGVTENQISAYIDDFKDRMNYSNRKEQYPLSSRSRRPDQDWDLTQKRVLQEMMSDYPIKVSAASQQWLPTQSSEYSGYKLYWDLCQHCYSIEMNKLTNMLLSDLNKMN